MDKKITYYIIAAVVLLAVVVIIIAMQISKPLVNPPAIGGSGKTETPKKSETETAKEIGKQLSATDLPLRVTMDDNGQSASMTPGKSLVLMLGTDYNWEITSSDENVLAKRDVKIDDARVQAVYQIVQAGKAVLSANGVCKTKCDQKTASFQFNIDAVISDNIPKADLGK